jgi:hypothetical protein
MKGKKCLETIMKSSLCGDGIDRPLTAKLLRIIRILLLIVIAI